MIFRIMAFLMTSMKSRSDAINSAINPHKDKDNGSGINNNMDDESKHTSNVIAMRFCYLFMAIMGFCVIFPDKQFKHFAYNADENIRRIDLFFFRWDFGQNLEQYIVYTSTGDFLFDGMSLISFVITAFYKPGK